jgi:hypothetical protein
VERSRLVLEEFQPRLVDSISSVELLRFWDEELRFEFKGHELPAGGGLFSAARLFKPSFEVDWLPAVEGRRGLAPRGQLVAPPVVRTPPSGPPVPVEDRGDSTQALAEARRRALVAGGTVSTDVAWRSRVLTPAALAGDRELRELVILLPEVLESHALALQSAGSHQLLLALHREADKRRRNTAGYLWENRAHFGGASARAVRRLIDLETRIGDLGRGMDRARTRLDHLGQINPPYTLEEVREASLLWRLLDSRLNRNGYCPEFREEALRLGLHYLEALVRLRPGRQATARTQEEWREELADAMAEWVHTYARDLKAVDRDGRLEITAAVAEAMGRLGPEAQSRWAQQDLTLRGERTRRTLAGEHGCPPGWVEENRAPSEAVFGEASGSYRERFGELLERL